MTVAIPSAIAATVPAAASATIAALSWSAFFTRACDVHGQRPPLQFLAVEHFDRFVRFVRRAEFDESESARFAGELIHHQIDGGYVAGGGKEILEIVFHCLVRPITNKQAVF